MKSYHIHPGAGLDGLVLREHDMPKPGRREVLVQVRACSLNFRELSILMQGRYPLPIRPDVVPVCDGAGTVVALGEGVTRVREGQRVASVVFPYWQDGPYSREVASQLGSFMDGMLTEYAILPEEGVIPIPEHLSFEEAATLPCAAVTAWNALTGGQGLSAGQTVLTLGSGGVSLFALQFAKLFGARVIATTSSAQKATRLKALGADAVINYRTTPEWHLAVRELTEGKGVEHVIEVGGPATIVQSIKATCVAGEVASIAFTSNAPASPDNDLHGALMGGLVMLRSIALGSRAQFLAMNQAITANKMRPVIDRVFPFAEARAAYSYYQEAQPFGKVLISLD
ncbi:NAD(P)-dependent alcohol dehydrogenase [Ktedonosporobacter rubrisoli]|uniref:NAD(P)-dependent alcohol dehydrogenase n=1 Tax=Ktedonosporobacter rubrisoli TaxID=2509675 RepID=A0A4P6JZY8_KTERU|nr:NAD(P)-dependent alcohol dehydrogenase [Ktedonosporobacter rubrisoli]QBD80706.1 NAD(P)-dependent alcohol dehydrogenase [Ktedonosporobacter rubrisoli]